MIIKVKTEVQEVSAQLDSGESAYDFIECYVRKYWEHNAYEDVIVNISISYDGCDWKGGNEYASPNFYETKNNEYTITWEYNWWEGQKYIRLEGVKAVSEIEISGGIYA